MKLRTSENGDNVGPGEEENLKISLLGCRIRGRGIWELSISSLRLFRQLCTKKLGEFCLSSIQHNDYLTESC